MAARVRRAGAGDVDALVRLRGVMFARLGADPGPPAAPWREQARAWFRERLADADTFAAFVVDVPGEGVVSVAVGTIGRGAPGPAAPDGRYGQVSNVATEPEHRRQGHARACLAALLAWFDDETDVSRVQLHASPDGAPLYRSLGFADDVPRMLRRR